MATQKKGSRKIGRAKHLRHTKSILDRRGHPAPMMTSMDLKVRTGDVLRKTRQRGAVAITTAGKPVAVALAPDHFVELCVAYAIRAIGPSASR